MFSSYIPLLICLFSYPISLALSPFSFLFFSSFSLAFHNFHNICLTISKSSYLPPFFVLIAIQLTFLHISLLSCDILFYSGLCNSDHFHRIHRSCVSLPINIYSLSPHLNLTKVLTLSPIFLTFLNFLSLNIWALSLSLFSSFYSFLSPYYIYISYSIFMIQFLSNISHFHNIITFTIILT